MKKKPIHFLPRLLTKYLISDYCWTFTLFKVKDRVNKIPFPEGKYIYPANSTAKNMAVVADLPLGEQNPLCSQLTVVVQII